MKKGGKELFRLLSRNISSVVALASVLVSVAAFAVFMVMMVMAAFEIGIGFQFSGKILSDGFDDIAADSADNLDSVFRKRRLRAHYKLGNLVAFVDFNGLQIDGKITEVMNPTPLDEKFAAFGWNVITIDAHDFEQIEAACKAARECAGKPTAVICRSIKGRGVSYMENQVGWHGKAPSEEQYNLAVTELTASV